MSIQRSCLEIIFVTTILFCNAQLLHANDLHSLQKKYEEFYVEGKYNEAIKVAKETIKIAKNTIPINKQVLAAAIDRLALVYKTLEQFEDAEQLYLQSLNIQRSLPIPNNPDLPTARNNLGLLYESWGKYDKAEKLLKRALGEWQNNLKSNDPVIATAYNNLGLLYFHQGMYEKSEIQYGKALGIWEASPQSITIPFISLLNNLGLLYENQGRLKKAETFYERALEKAKEAKINDAALIGRIRENLGGLKKSLGKRSEAETLLKSALKLKRKSFSDDNSKLSSLYAELGDLYRLNGNCKKSSEYFELARKGNKLEKNEIRIFYGTELKRDIYKNSIVYQPEFNEELSYGISVVKIPSNIESLKSVKYYKAKFIESSNTALTSPAKRFSLMCYFETPSLEKMIKNQNLLSGEEALIFIHGFNNSFEDSIRRAAQISNDIKFSGNVFVFNWASKNTFFGYTNDSETVSISSSHLADYLLDIIHNLKPEKIHFIAHSMGNRVLMSGLDKLTRKDKKHQRIIGEVINAAPDIPPTNYKYFIKQVIDSSQQEKSKNKFTLYGSSGDWALWLSSFIYGERVGIFLNDEPYTGFGFDTIDISNGGPTKWYYFNQSHNIYITNPIISKDIQKIILESARPPNIRTKELEIKSTKDNTAYWQLQ